MLTAFWHLRFAINMVDFVTCPLFRTQYSDCFTQYCKTVFGLLMYFCLLVHSKYEVFCREVLIWNTPSVCSCCALDHKGPFLPTPQHCLVHTRNLHRTSNQSHIFSVPTAGCKVVHIHKPDFLAGDAPSFWLSSTKQQARLNIVILRERES